MEIKHSDDGMIFPLNFALEGQAPPIRNRLFIQI